MDFPQLLEANAVEKYKLGLRYDDGTERYLDLTHLAGKGVFTSWDIDDKFFKVHVNPILHGITWNDELDICSDNAYLKLKGISFEEWKSQNSSHAAA